MIKAMGRWSRRVWHLVNRHRFERELEREMAAHRAMMGEPRRFGNTLRLREEAADVWGWRWLDDLVRDLRYGVRQLVHAPAFAATAILTLTIAIGATTTMFSVVHAVIVRPLPYRAPEQLAMIWTAMPGQTLQGRSAYATVENWRRYSTSFAEIAVLDPVWVTLTKSEGAERISAARISPNFFPLLGIQPMQGRSFSQEEAEQGERLALISDRFWRARFGGSPTAIGASLMVDGRPSRIIGIFPVGDLPAFTADIWKPHTLFPGWETRRSARGAGSWFVVGRLRPDVTVDQAQSEMSALARTLDDELPAAERNLGVSVTPLSLLYRRSASAPGAVAADGRGLMRAADRCGQRRGPLAGAQHLPSARDGDSHGCRRPSSANRAATPR